MNQMIVKVKFGTFSPAANKPCTTKNHSFARFQRAVTDGLKVAYQPNLAYTNNVKLKAP